VTTDAVAGFGQVKWNFTRALSLTVGGRYNDETKSVDEVASPRASITLATTPYSNQLNFTKFTPAVTLEYAVPEGIVYATYSQGFKSGGFNYPAVGAVILKPETLNNYELGFKGHFLDRKIYLTMSAYYYDYRNLQVTRAATAGIGPVVTTQNAANATLYGLDADATWRVTPDFTLNGSISLEHSVYKNYQASAFEYVAVATGVNAPGMLNVGFNASGHPLLRAPDFSAFVSANYDFHLPGAKIPLSLSYAYKSAFDFDFIINPTSSVLRQPGYGLLNARIGYEPVGARWSLAAYVRNLADQKYFIDVVAAGTGIRGAYGDPRTYGVEMKVRF
jgi:iron complex outermembrane receptor protein